MSKRRNGRRRVNRNLITRGDPDFSPNARVHGRGVLDPTVTNSGGVYVSTRFEIDTDLFTQWSDFASVYEKWRIKELKFFAIPQEGFMVNNLGHFCVSVIEDPDSATAVSCQQQLNAGVHSKLYGRFWNPELDVLVYKPRHCGWLFTDDGGISDDRFEMVGDILLGTENYTTSIKPFNLVVEYDVEFSVPANHFLTTVPKLLRTHPELKMVLEKGQKDSQVESGAGGQVPGSPGIVDRSAVLNKISALLEAL